MFQTFAFLVIVKITCYNRKLFRDRSVFALLNGSVDSLSIIHASGLREQKFM